MNIAGIGARSNGSNTIYAGNLQMLQRPALKSTQEKVERQRKAAGQIEFWENQKESLKNMKCSTLEEIAKKLEKFQSYEDEISAVKKAYNQEQMWHVMDEAKEIGEKIAEEAEKMKPKTAEERREEMQEEALGTDESKGELMESLEQLQDEVAELAEEMEEAAEETLEKMEEEMEALAEENLKTAAEEEITEISDMYRAQGRPADVSLLAKYRRIDMLV